MQTSEIAIVNRLGLHARAAAKFVQTAGQFPCQIEVSRGDKKINGKSIMGVMMLAAAQGVIIEISTDGTDEEAALDALVT
ncbi:MAG: HPr family phosphocarrier protein, partial [Gammaproteobacteria bacterium]|nr:HPr family phosphocarrier protein [Gammaproteobacteria bacterium]